MPAISVVFCILWISFLVFFIINVYWSKGALYQNILMRLNKFSVEFYLSAMCFQPYAFHRHNLIFRDAFHNEISFVILVHKLCYNWVKLNTKKRSRTWCEYSVIGLQHCAHVTRKTIKSRGCIIARHKLVYTEQPNTTYYPNIILLNTLLKGIWCKHFLPIYRVPFSLQHSDYYYWVSYYQYIGIQMGYF